MILPKAPVALVEKVKLLENPPQPCALRACTRTWTINLTVSYYEKGWYWLLDKKSLFILLIMMDYVGNLVLRVWLERKKDVTSPLGRSVPVSPANCNFTAPSSSNWFIFRNQQNIWQLSFDSEVKLAYPLTLWKDLILLAKVLRKKMVVVI